MRRVPAFVWILLPLVIGLLYAAGHALLAPRPTLADVAPTGALLVHRVRGLDMLDLTSPGPRAPGRRPPREALGLERNNPNLIGVDASDWVHLVLMPRTLSLDSTMAIFRASDPDAFAREFMRTDFLERGLIRHAQHLYRSGPWIAVGPNRDATRRIGTGSLACADLGEDWSMVADLPRLLDHALTLAKHYPWRSILATLGLDVDAARMTLDPKTQEISAFVPGDERVLRIRRSWRTVRLWAWHTEGRLRVDLEPAAGTPLRQALARVTSEAPPPPPTLPSPPANAEGWLRIETQADLPLLARVLLAAGVRLVAEGADDPLGGLGAPREAGTSGLLLWAARGLGTGYAWSLGLGAHVDELPYLAPFLPLPAAGAASRPLPPGAAPLTIGDTTTKRKVPAGTVERAQRVPASTGPAAYDLVTFGPGAKEALEGMKAALARPEGGVAGRSGAKPEPGMREIASFFLRQRRAEKILGRALQPGGFLAMLANGDLRGALYTDGHLLRLLVHVER